METSEHSVQQAGARSSRICPFDLHSVFYDCCASWEGGAEHDLECVAEAADEHCSAKLKPGETVTKGDCLTQLKLGHINKLITCSFAEESALSHCCEKSTIAQGTRCFEEVTAADCNTKAEAAGLSKSDSDYATVVERCKMNALDTLSDAATEAVSIPIDNDGNVETICNSDVISSSEPCCYEPDGRRMAECILAKAEPCTGSEHICCAKATLEKQTDCLCAESNPDQAICCAYPDIRQRAACLAGPKLESSDPNFDPDLLKGGNESAWAQFEKYDADMHSRKLLGSARRRAESGRRRSCVGQPIPNGVRPMPTIRGPHEVNSLPGRRRRDQNEGGDFGSNPTSEQLTEFGRNELDSCCACLANMAGAQYVGSSLATVLEAAIGPDVVDTQGHEHVDQQAGNPVNQNGDPLPDTPAQSRRDAAQAGCISPVCRNARGTGTDSSVANNYFYISESDSIRGSSSCTSHTHDDLPPELCRARGNSCDQPGHNWCDSEYGCAMAHVNPRCVKCACVPECTAWTATEYGDDSAELNAMEAECNREDGQDFGCVVEQLESTFCVGNTCDLVDDPVVSIVLAFTVYIADMLLGCALGFVAQPSFWINVIGDATTTHGQEVDEYQHVKTNLENLEGVVNGGRLPDPQDAADATEMTRGDNTIRRDLRHYRNRVANRNAAARNAAEVVPDSSLPAATTASRSTGIYRNVADAVDSVQTNLPMAPSKMKEFMRKGLKNCVPCLIATMIGMAAAFIPGAGAFAFAASCAAFFGCMKGCMVVSLGFSMAFLVFDMVTNCLWEVLGQALASACFPADATVKLQSGRHVPMKDLEVGDFVQSGPGSYSEVYVFSHQVLSSESTFVQVKVQTGQSLKLSPQHFIPVSEACDGTTEMKHAADIKVGSCVLAAEGEEMIFSRVGSIDFVFSKGLYNPFTREGNIIVDGILASSHSSWFLDDLVNDVGGPAYLQYLPTIYQAVLAPARWMYDMVGPEIARVELEKYQDKLNTLTDANSVFAPFIDLGWRVFEIVTQ